MRTSFFKKCFISLLTAAVVAASMPAGTVYAKTSVKRASWSLSKLSAPERQMYDHFISELQRILREGGSTRITFDASQYGLTLTSEQQADDTAEKLYTYAANNHPELLSYESLLGQQSYTVESPSDLSYFAISIIVDSADRGVDQTDQYHLDSAFTAKETSAEAVAAKVISDNAGKGIYDTIKAYADWISDHVSYDHTAASWDDNAISDSSPWSLVSVFDDDASTNVVCEGYSKAFQYLMDNTRRFVDAGISSKLVTSDTHMWNVVTIDGKNYLVDVTWYDDDTVDHYYNPDFLLGGQNLLDRIDAGTYSYTDSSGVTRYLGAENAGLHTYEQDTEDFYTADELKLSDTAYDKSTESQTGNQTGNSENTGNNTSGNSGNSTGSTSGSGTSGTAGGTTGTATGGTTGSTSGNTGSSASNNSTSGDTTPSLPVQYNTSGALPGGDTSYSYPPVIYTPDTTTDDSSGQISDIESQKGNISKLTAGKNKLTASFSRNTVTGSSVKYQVAIKQKSAKSWKKAYVSSTKKTFTKLKKGKIYWVSVRPYITVDGTRYFGSWSKTLTKKVK
ncbi:MAG: hypothetical protein PUF16_06760 [Lachnospiraceae bacterium]|nr:hypothetical protein [Lachnospiraceae bacterium]